MGTVRSTSIEFGCPNYDGVRTSVPRPIPRPYSQYIPSSLTAVWVPHTQKTSRSSTCIESSIPEVLIIASCIVTRRDSPILTKNSSMRHYKRRVDGRTYNLNYRELSSKMYKLDSSDRKQSIVTS